MSSILLTLSFLCNSQQLNIIILLVVLMRIIHTVLSFCLTVTRYTILSVCLMSSKRTVLSC